VRIAVGPTPRRHETGPYKGLFIRHAQAQYFNEYRRWVWISFIDGEVVEAPQYDFIPNKYMTVQEFMDIEIPNFKE